MRCAPPVRVLCRGGGWRALQSGLVALAAGALCNWLLRHAGLGAWPAAAAAAGTALLSGLVAWHAWRADPVEVIWDGQCWRAGGQAGGLDVMLDLGAWLLLRLRPEGAAGVRWMAVSARDAGAAMHGLRAALYARVPAATLGPGPVPPPRG